MERVELITAAILAIVSLLVGFGLYSIFFHPLTAELRPRYKGGRKRLAVWLKAHRKGIVLTVVLIATGLVLLWAAFRFGGQIVEQVRKLIPRLQRAEGPLDPASASQDRVTEPAGGAVSGSLGGASPNAASGGEPASEGEAGLAGEPSVPEAEAGESYLDAEPGSSSESTAGPTPETELLQTWSVYGEDSPEPVPEPAPAPEGALGGDAGSDAGGDAEGEEPVFTDPYSWE